MQLLYEGELNPVVALFSVEYGEERWGIEALHPSIQTLTMPLFLRVAPSDTWNVFCSINMEGITEIATLHDITHNSVCNVAGKSSETV